MKTLRLATLLLAAASLTLRAQEPTITLDTPASTEQLHAWLHSDDPRLIAWTATLARTHQNSAIATEIPSVIEHWSFPQITTSDATQANRQHALLAMLDTLIQLQADVPLTTIRAIDKHFATQALLLIRSKPLTETRSILDDWALGPDVGYAPALQRVAIMLLAKDPRGSQTIVREDSPMMTSLVASIVSSANERLHVSVVLPGSNVGGGQGSGAACGDSFGGSIHAGWPKVYAYDLDENQGDGEGTLIVDLANDRITADRFDVDGAWGSCYGVQPLNAITRHRLIAYWLGISPDNMAWRPETYEQLSWKDEATFERELGALVAKHNLALRQTAHRLAAAGLLTSDEADSVAPRLVVDINCSEHTCSNTQP